MKVKNKKPEAVALNIKMFATLAYTQNSSLDL